MTGDPGPPVGAAVASARAASRSSGVMIWRCALQSTGTGFRWNQIGFIRRGCLSVIKKKCLDLKRDLEKNLKLRIR
ncbi:MAG: hypothetical protein KGL90_11240 [Burkholderiales bacterium]|nr:hypothetical protein [Burkholderiales bacterium]